MEHDGYGVTGWDDCGEMAQRDGGGDIRRLEGDGDFATGVVLGQPYGRKLHWTGETFVTCEGDGCKYCADVLAISKKFWLNWFCIAVGNGDNTSERPNVLEVLEVSSKGLKSFLASKKKYGFEKNAFECKRDGVKLKTTYNVLPDVLVEDLDPDVKAKLDAASENLVDLPALAKRFAEGGGDDDDRGGSSKPAAGASRAKQSGGKIDSETAGDIAARLRVIDRGVARELLKQYGANSVGQLPADRVAGFLQDLAEAEGGEGGDVDPFAF